MANDEHGQPPAEVPLMMGMGRSGPLPIPAINRLNRLTDLIDPAE
jgi:hypothetical protein